ncbi:MAG: hypothetical protein AUJ97_06135 [Bacteroidetes bacterium CG2_30_32_10]|nr:MAG: hypothetical protein AUJ97_06135 [Bacteroidetes bacterium CG2_30_32_10]
MGYGLPAFGQKTPYIKPSIQQMLYPDEVKFDATYFSLGNGVYANVSWGHLINKNVSFELGLGYEYGIKIKRMEIQTNSPDSITDQMFSYQSKMFYICPSLVFKTDFEKINPYARIGMLIGKPSYTENIDITVESYMGQIPENIVTEYNGGIGLGINSALGVDVKLSDKMIFYAECNIIDMTYAPKKSEITTYQINNVDRLQNLPMRDKEIEYVYLYEDVASQTNNQDQPKKELKFKMPYGSVGANIGIKMRF